MRSHKFNGIRKDQHGFTFNGVRKNYIITLRGKRRPPWAPLEHTIETVPGLPGGYVMDTVVKPRRLEIPILVESKNFADLKKMKEDLADWLITDEPKELIFDDEPDRSYFAMLDESSDIEAYIRVGIGKLYFICVDPYKYGQSRDVDIEDTDVVYNNGTAEAEPIFKLTANKQSTYAMISNGTDYMMVGRPHEVQETPKDTRPIVLNDQASTLVGWSSYTPGSDFYGLGLVGGEMRVHGGYAFVPESFGENPNGWTGPAIRRTLSRPLQNFQVEIDIAILNSMNGVGRIAVVGLDNANQPVFGMQMFDSTVTIPNNRVMYHYGPDMKMWYSYQGDRGLKVWNNGRFLLRLGRHGRSWTSRTAKKLTPDGKEQSARHHRNWMDMAHQYQNPVSQIAIYMARARTYDDVGMLFHHLKINEILGTTSNEVEYIVGPDDEIIFDHKNASAYINGDPVPFDFGGDFFKLAKGNNALAVVPENTFDTNVKFRERYK